MQIKDYLLNKDRYKIDETYQRPAGAWNRKDKQCLIDTIMRWEPIPLIFINTVDLPNGQEDKFIVDGQQRLESILDFYQDKFPLSKEFSDERLDGKKYSDLSQDDRDRFLNYKLEVREMENYDDERIRMIFSRLQRGKPLNIGERLNAMPGKIVESMRQLAKHEFVTKSIGVNKQRYHVYEDVARMMFFEVFGLKECSNNYIYDLFDRYREDFYIDSKMYKDVQKVLNFLLKCFPAQPGNYQYLSKHAWVHTVYSVIAELMNSYALEGREDDIRNFVERFHGRIYSEDRRSGNPDYTRFYDNARGGWGITKNTIRRDIMKKYMIDQLQLKPLDDNRQISDEEKVQAYERANGCCEMCGKQFKDYKEAEYHHKEEYHLGGATNVDNIMVLCTECHDEIHRTKK